MKYKELYAKLSKCEFWLKYIAFLGHIVSTDGIRVDTQNIKAVQSWHIPTSPMDVSSFLGLDGYYRRFFEGFLSISCLFTKLTHKKVKIQWPEAYDQILQEL